MPGTSSAFVLLSTIRLRRAFLSPGAGGLPLCESSLLFFFVNLKVVFSPRFGGAFFEPVPGLAAFATPAIRKNGGVVVKDAAH